MCWLQKALWSLVFTNEICALAHWILQEVLRARDFLWYLYNKRLGKHTCNYHVLVTQKALVKHQHGSSLSANDIATPQNPPSAKDTHDLIPDISGMIVRRSYHNPWLQKVLWQIAPVLTTNTNTSLQLLLTLVSCSCLLPLAIHCYWWMDREHTPAATGLLPCAALRPRSVGHLKAELWETAWKVAPRAVTALGKIVCEFSLTWARFHTWG